MTDGTSRQAGQDVTVASDGSITEETTALVVRQVKELKKFYRRTLEQAWKLGKTLKEIKGRVRHGEWLPWLGRVDLAPRVAQRCMNLYERDPEMRLVTHFQSITQALRELPAKSSVVIDVNPDAVSVKGANEPGAVVSATETPNQRGEDDTATLGSGDPEMDTPLRESISSTARDSRPSESRRQTERVDALEDVGAISVSSSGAEDCHAISRNFVQQVIDALDSLQSAIEQVPVNTAGHLHRDLGVASDVIRVVVRTVQQRIDQESADDPWAELGSKLRLLFKNRSNGEKVGQDGTDTDGASPAS